MKNQSRTEPKNKYIHRFILKNLEETQTSDSLKELLLAQEKLETKIRQINNEYFELQQHVKEMEEKII